MLSTYFEAVCFSKKTLSIQDADLILYIILSRDATESVLILLLRPEKNDACFQFFVKKCNIGRHNYLILIFYIYALWILHYICSQFSSYLAIRKVLFTIYNKMGRGKNIKMSGNRNHTYIYSKTLETQHFVSFISGKSECYI